MKVRRFRIVPSFENGRDIPEDFLSLTIDTSLAFGGRWWGEGSGVREGVGLDIASPLDVDNRRLLKLASFLAPAMLRIGGTEADRLRYWPKKKGRGKGPKSKDCSPARENGEKAADGKNAPTETLIELVLRRRLWKRINSFARKAGFTILFTSTAAEPGDVISWHYYPQQSSRGPTIILLLCGKTSWVEEHTRHPGLKVRKGNSGRTFTPPGDPENTPCC